jgi:hypothetical protein
MAWSFGNGRYAGSIPAVRTTHSFSEMMYRPNAVAMIAKGKVNN